jgi:hypothetical protein
MSESEAAGRSFVRRLRVLAHLQPLLDIEHDKNRAARAGGAKRSWDEYDMRLLQVAAFDAIAAEYGLHPEGGVPRTSVEAAVGAQAARSAPGRTSAEHAEVASWLIDRLLNVGYAARGFDVPWINPVSSSRELLRVVALYETLTSEGEVRLHADEAALNLTLAGLDLDLEDRQIAAEAVLRAQIESGRWSQAEQSAAVTQRMAVEYRNRLDRYLGSVERDLRDIDWEIDVETVLEAALAHLENRVRALHQLSDHAAQLAEDVDPKSRTQAASVVRLVGDTLEHLLRLQQHIQVARSRFRAAQIAQGFAISLDVGKIQLHDDVFKPLLALPAASAEDMAMELVRVSTGVTPPKVVSLATLTDILLTRPREREEALVDVDLGDLEEIGNPFERFDDDAWAVARELMAQIGPAPIALSKLLAGADDDIALLVALCSMRCWGERGSSETRDPMLIGIAAVESGVELTLDRFRVPDLLLSRSNGGVDARR